MAMTAIPLTSLYLGSGQQIGGSANLLNTNDDWFAWLFEWPGGDLTRCALGITAAVGTPVGTVQLFDVDATSAASPVNTASPIGSAVDTATLVANTMEIVTGIGTTGLAAGIYALRIIFNSGTSFSFLTRLDNSRLYAAAQYPMGVSVTNGGAQADGSAISGALALGSNSAWTLIPSLTPPGVFTTATFGSGSTPDEYGVWFANPWPVDVRIAGVAAPHIASTRPDTQISYYSGTLGSPSQDLAFTIDRDLTRNAGTGGGFYMFPTKQTLVAGGSAGILFRAISAENLGISYYDYGFGNESMMDAFWGQNYTLVTRSGGTGSLSQVTYQTPVINVLVDGMDPGSVSPGGASAFTGYGGLGYWIGKRATRRTTWRPRK